MRTVVFGRTRSRQVLGVMNDFAVQATFCLRDGLSSTETALHVAQAPMKPLGYAAPCEVAVAVLRQAAKPGPQLSTATLTTYVSGHHASIGSEVIDHDVS
jgi:hypothetical protein